MHPRTDFDETGWASLRLSVLSLLVWVLAIVFLPGAWWIKLLTVMLVTPLLVFAVFSAGFFTGQRTTYDDFPRLMREEEDHEPFPDVSSGGYAFLVDDGVNRLH